MDTVIKTAQESVVTYGLSVIAAIAIFLVGKWLARILANTLTHMMKRAGTDDTLVSFVANIAHVAMMVFVVIAAMSELGVETTSFAAVLAAAGLAIGLALQGSLSNFASGVMLILFKPFKTGDFIEAAGTSGIVEEIQIFSTKLRSGDNKQLFIPNGAIFGGTITNYSTKPTRRVDMLFGCGYDDDLKAAKQLLNDIIAKDGRILAEPAPVIAVSELADSSVNFVVRPWVNAADYWNVYFDTHEQVKLRFDEAGISIPYPHTDVHLHQSEAA
jgi:small conductance mechanosensitive channel